jgi:hypothetical protein
MRPLVAPPVSDRGRDLLLPRRDRELVAFRPGGSFSGTVMTGDATIDAAVGRTAFGIGAVMTWLAPPR